jgi:DNA-binding MarR family transcriptional regulator
VSALHETLLRIVRKGYDLTDRQKCVLYAVQSKARTVRDMAGELSVSKPAISRAVDRLTDEGYTDRKDDPDDRRSILVATTKKGRELIAFMENP